MKKDHCQELPLNQRFTLTLKEALPVPPGDGRQSGGPPGDLHRAADLRILRIDGERYRPGKKDDQRGQAAPKGEWEILHPFHQNQGRSQAAAYDR